MNGYKDRQWSLNFFNDGIHTLKRNQSFCKYHFSLQINFKIYYIPKKSIPQLPGSLWACLTSFTVRSSMSRKYNINFISSKHFFNSILKYFSCSECIGTCEQS